MAERSVILMGPGGVGKGPAMEVFTVDRTWNPYRMRIKGPKPRDRTKYVSPTVYLQFQLVLQNHIEKPVRLGELPDAPLIDDIPEWSSILRERQKRLFDDNRKHVLWYPKSQVLFYPVRKEQFQMLFLDGDGTMRAELYAPAAAVMLREPALRTHFGELVVLVLNPTSNGIMEGCLKDLEDRTRINAEERDGKGDSAEGRVRSVSEELPAWQSVVGEGYGRDCSDWKFPEWRYIRPDRSVQVLKLEENERTSLEKRPEQPFSPEQIKGHQRELLKMLRAHLCETDAVEPDFLKEDNDIEAIEGFIVDPK